MAAELKFNARGLTGATLYAVVLNSAGQAYNGSTFEALVALNWATYDIALTEQASLGIWLGTFPVVAAGLYETAIYQQAGGTPATTDVQVGQGTMDWTGTREQSMGKTLPDNAAAGASGGVMINTTLTEPAAVPAWATATAMQWLAWIGALARNKVTETATTQTLRNDADNANIATSTVSDDGSTFTRGEWS